MDTTQTHDVYDERTWYGDIIVRMTETHRVWIPGYNVVDDDNDWVKWTILARCCLGQGWTSYTSGLGIGGWVYVVGPSSIKRWDWQRMPLVVIRLHGDVIGVAAQPDRLQARHRRVMRRREYQDLAYDEMLVASGTVRPWAWGLPGMLLHVPDTYDRYCVRFRGSRLVYHVIHVRHPSTKKPHTLIRAVARADTLADTYWSARYALNSKYIKLLPFRV